MFEAAPDEWEQVVLIDCLDDFRNGWTYDTKAVDGTLPITRIETVSKGVIDYSKVGYAQADERIEAFRLRPNDILFSHINSVEHIAKVAIKRDEAVLYHGMNLMRLRPNGRVDPDFLFARLQSEETRDHFRASCKRAVNQASLNKGEIGSYAFLLPPLDEQSRIAEVLRSVDEAVSSADATVRQADTSLKLLAERLLVTDAEANGREARIGDLLASIDAGVSVNSEGRTAADGELGILKTSCVSAGRFDPAEHKSVLEHERTRVRVQPTADSIIVSRMNTPDLVGANAFVADDHPNLYLPDRLWLLKTTADVRCRWLAYYMKTARFREQIVDIASGTSGSMKNISKGRFSELPIFVPAIEIQDASVDVLSSVEASGLRAASALECNKRMRSSLSCDLLSGRIRVPA